MGLLPDRVTCTNLCHMQNEEIPTWTLGERLQKARVWAGIKKADDMAALFFRHKNTISNWETDKTRPSTRVLAKWSEVTGVPLWWLLGDDIPDSEPGSVDRRAPRSVTGEYAIRRMMRSRQDQHSSGERHLHLACAV